MMGSNLRTVFFCSILAFAFAHNAGAQTEDATYIVSYIEVVASATEEAKTALSSHVASSRNADGILQIQALQRIGRPNHFALIEIWRSEQAQQAHAASSQTASFRARLEPMLYSPYDERVHVHLDVAAVDAGANSAIYGLTHVDVTPNNLEPGVEQVKAQTAASRRDAGNHRFDAVTQVNRRNHMTVIEAWASQEAKTAHEGAAHTKAFRTALHPLAGALYDERLYRRL